MRKINKVLEKRNLKRASSQDLDFYNRKIFMHRSLFVLFGLIILLATLLTRIGYIQFVKGEEYSTAAYKQQTKSEVISPKRGIIYDSTGKVLARSSTVYTISVNPGKIFYKDDTKVSNELLAEKFSELFDLKYDDVSKAIEESEVHETIAKTLEAEDIQEPLSEEAQIEEEIAKTKVDLLVAKDDEPTHEDLLNDTIPFVVDTQEIVADEEDEEEDSTPNKVLNIILIVLIVVLIAVLGVIIYWILMAQGIL